MKHENLKDFVIYNNANHCLYGDLCDLSNRGILKCVLLSLHHLNTDTVISKKQHLEGTIYSETRHHSWRGTGFAALLLVGHMTSTTSLKTQQVSQEQNQFYYPRHS